MNAHEKSEYCRKNGLYVNQLEEWEKVCAYANESATKMTSEFRAEKNEDARKIKELERELVRKEKAVKRHEELTPWRH